VHLAERGLGALGGALHGIAAGEVDLERDDVCSIPLQLGLRALKGAWASRSCMATRWRLNPVAEQRAAYLAGTGRSVGRG
jgi:hypothetical protein